jgi:hypothetical protein
MEPKLTLDDLLDEFEDTITVSNPGALSGTLSSGYSTDTITLSGNLWNATNNTVIGGGYSYPNTISATGGPFTINSGAGIGTGYPWATASTKIKLDGEGADIEVNGKSLMDMIGKIEQRLNILHPNTELEAEWEELRALGEQYRKLEQHIKDKQATWDKLKAMPPPVID